MQVPKDLSDRQHLKTGNRQIFLTCFEENAPSRIYTEVKENLLVIVRKGQKRVAYKDYMTNVGEGEFAFFQKGNYVMNQILSDCYYESLLIFVDNSFIKNFRNRAYRSAISTSFYQGNVNEWIQDEVNLLLKLMRSKEGEYDDILELKIKELFLYLLKDDEDGEFQNLLNAIAADLDFESFILDSYDQFGSLSELAAHLNMSLSTFKRRFDETFHCTPHKWMNDKKLEKATTLIDTTDQSVIDICFLCGFESMSTFHSLFKRKFGMSPTEYRKR